jgi:hypothetical protein
MKKENNTHIRKLQKVILSFCRLKVVPRQTQEYFEKMCLKELTCLLDGD